MYDFAIAAKVDNCSNENGNECMVKSESKTIFKDGIPSSPIELNLVDVSPFDALIEWKQPNVINGNSILDYLIDVIPGCNPRDKLSYCESFCSKPFSLHTNETQIKIDNLKPYNNYEITVSAKTKHPTYGPKADKDLIVSTPPAIPGKPRIVKAYQTSAGNLMIRFKHACPLTGNTDFEVQWRCQSDSKERFCGNRTRIKQYLHGNDKIEVVGLEGGHFYDVTLNARVKNCWNEDGSTCVNRSKSEIVFLGKFNFY